MHRNRKLEKTESIMKISQPFNSVYNDTHHSTFLGINTTSNVIL